MSTSVRIRFETLKRLHELRKYPAETLDSVISRLIAHYLGEPEPPVILWGDVGKRRPIIKLHAIPRKGRLVKASRSSGIQGSRARKA